jgi:glycosyltransferase involved in cell wall biosynthesis
MNIVFFTTCGNKWGGSEVLWARTAKEALKNGHNVAISIFNWDTQHESITELIELGAVTFFRRPFYPNLSLRLKKKFLNLFLPKGNKFTYNNPLFKFQPDHIFFNLAGGNEIIEDSEDLFIFIKQLRLPFSVFYHSNLNKNQLTSIQKRSFQFVISKAKQNYFTSHFQIKLIEDEIGILLKNYFILCHPLRVIRPSVFKQLDVIRLCVIGNIVYRWKGQDILINILSKPHWRNLKWHLNIYGEGDDKENMKNLIVQNKIEDKVTLHGYEKDINTIFSKNDLVIIPSRKDSGPIVMFEAMLAGLPVVGSKMGVMPDYIIHGKNGALADDIDEESIEMAMAFAILNKDKWQLWGDNARNQILDKYDFNPHITLLKIITNEKKSQE